jgi:hypothetical protein
VADFSAILICLSLRTRPASDQPIWVAGKNPLGSWRSDPSRPSGYELSPLVWFQRWEAVLAFGEAYRDPDWRRK